MWDQKAPCCPTLQLEEALSQAAHLCHICPDASQAAHQGEVGADVGCETAPLVLETGQVCNWRAPPSQIAINLLLPLTDEAENNSAGLPLSL